MHGAGRVMSRTAAAGKRHRKTGRVLTPGRVTPEMMHEWVPEKGVVLRGGGLDESPHVYRRLPEVLAAQGATIEVLHTLRPLIVVMAGRERVRSVQGLTLWWAARPRRPLDGFPPQHAAPWSNGMAPGFEPGW